MAIVWKKTGGFYIFANVFYILFFVNIRIQIASILSSLYQFSQTNTIKSTFSSIRSHSQIDWGIRKHSQVSAELWGFLIFLIVLGRNDSQNVESNEPSKAPYPKHVFCIIGTEFCERVTYFGMCSRFSFWFWFLCS